MVGAVSKTNFSFRHWRHLGYSRFLAKGGGGGQEKLGNFWNFLGGFVVFVLFSGVRGENSKTIKTGLNCREDAM